MTFDMTKMLGVVLIQLAANIDMYLERTFLILKQPRFNMFLFKANELKGRYERVGFA